MSRRTQRRLVVLALLGLGIAGYLSWQRLLGGNIACIGGSQACDVVNASAYALWLGIPVAYLGFATYAALLVLALAARRLPALYLVLWAISLIGLLFSAYLTWVEVAVLHAICQWCVASALVMVAFVAVASLGLREDEGA